MSQGPLGPIEVRLVGEVLTVEPDPVVCERKRAEKHRITWVKADRSEEFNFIGAELEDPPFASDDQVVKDHYISAINHIDSAARGEYPYDIEIETPDGRRLSLQMPRPGGKGVIRNED